ncbi:MAG: hypothetical protein AAF182_00240 [Pseudomonadota bacterium]
MKKVLAVLALIVIAGTAQAAECYSELEAEAEQGIRIHSELMVIGLNCQHMAKRYDIDLYGTYRKITSEHADLFAMYEEALMKFYSGRGEAAERKINALRTGFANKISNDAASMRPDIFCGMYAKRLDKVSDMEEQNIREWASTFYDSHPVSYPICKS